MATITRPSARHPAFRIVVLVTSSVAAILFVLTAVAVVRYGDRVQAFGWTPARAGGVLVVDRVDPGGPAGGALQPGDAIVAWNGDPRIVRIGPAWYRRMPAGASYALTIRRGGREQAVTLTALDRHDVDQWRLTLSSLVAALVWFVVATMIAMYRPDQTVSRSAYAAGMVMGFFMLGMARGSLWLATENTGHRRLRDSEKYFRNTSRTKRLSKYFAASTGSSFSTHLMSTTTGPGRSDRADSIRDTSILGGNGFSRSNRRPPFAS